MSHGFHDVCWNTNIERTRGLKKGSVYRLLESRMLTYCEQQVWQCEEPRPLLRGSPASNGSDHYHPRCRGWLQTSSPPAVNKGWQGLHCRHPQVWRVDEWTMIREIATCMASACLSGLIGWSFLSGFLSRQLACRQVALLHLKGVSLPFSDRLVAQEDWSTFGNEIDTPPQNEGLLCMNNAAKKL